MPLFTRKKSDTPPRRRTLHDDTFSRSDERDRQAATYRRGITRAGSTGHTLRTAQTHALNAATPREKVHHLTGLRRKLTTLLSGLLVAIIVLIIFLQQFTASVETSFAGDIKVKHAPEYTNAIQKYLSNHPLERLRFNLDVDALTAFVGSTHPEVESIKQIGYATPVTTEFYVTMRKPVVSWQVQDKLYYVDAHGVSFTRNVFAAPAVTIVDNSGVDHTAGTAIASARFLSFVGRVVALAQQNTINVQQVIIPTGTSRQVELRVEGREYPVIMSIDRSAGEQVEDMVRALEFFSRQGKQPGYIDLRVKGKAFYRE